jgi:lipooligosaccharide transport system ATP-binding protein
MSPLSVSTLRKSYERREVVAGLSFELRRGECYGLLGPNGAGKTTTLRCCLGLTMPDSGEILLAGEPVPERAREARMKIGVVPQFDNLDPDFTAAENLIVYGRYFGMADADIRPLIPGLLEFAGLAGKEKASIRSLSGGMKRRLTLARALVNDPELLLLDEPTTGLDPQARHLIWERLKRLLAQGKTILLTTHFMDEAERLCQRLAIIDGGRMVGEGPPRELIRQHIEPQVVEVYGEDAPGWAEREAKAYSHRVETSGETAFCYVADATQLLARLADQPGLRTLHRPANLEDVFLKLTGRELRD